MIADSCSCSGTNVQQGCKAAGRLTPGTWCPGCCSTCDHNKARRRCQSEAPYQESDPLKELNRCCDKGCDYIHYSPHHSQIRKTADPELEDKKLQCSDNVDMEVGDVYHTAKKHHTTKSHKEKGFQLQRNSQFHGFNQDMTTIHNSVGLPNALENTRKTPIGVVHHRSKDTSVEKNYTIGKHEKLRHSLPRYNCIGDAPDVELPSSKSMSYSEQDKCSSEMRDRYIREMEILRSKLNLLKGEIACDGKRLRQRSESEPGFAGAPGGVPKRARDNSPKLQFACRKLPPNPPVNPVYNKMVNKQIMRCKDSKSIMSSTKHLSPSKATQVDSVEDQLSFQQEVGDDKNKDDSSESDLEGSICDEELPSQEDANISEDDDHSVLSSTTSVSTDSNTPSQVGETLGSITLSEPLKKDVGQTESVKATLPKPVPMNDSEYIERINALAKSNSPLRVSLFSNVPPYVKFFMHDCKGPTLPSDITRHLKWKLSSVTPIVIRRTLINSGFKLVRSELTRGSFVQYYNLIYVPPHRMEDHTKPFNPWDPKPKRKFPKESNDWTGQWGKHMKSFVFKTLKDFQKLNHFPGTFQIGRKDRLWKNMFRLMVKFGKKEFGFIPKTYILPQDSKLLRTAWEKASGLGKGQWIVKPPAAARGTGIKVVHKWGQIPKKRPLIVQKYIAKPYLINGSKFDLRLYVLMTSIHPLRIYLYDDGLVRFASVKYSEDVQCLRDRFMHLTNYSINKLSTQYCANEDASSCRGHKWTLKALWTYLSKQGVNVKVLRKNLIDLVIKTIISGESSINLLSKNNLPSRYCSYELFGIDVLLDHTLKPWLLEVNISPSLHSASPLDLAVKGPLVRELLNIAGFQVPAKMTPEQEESFLTSFGLKDKTNSLCYDKRLYWTTLSKEERLKHETHHAMTRDEYLNTILEDLTPDDIRHLIQFEDELTQLSRFEKVFPTPRTHCYHQFFESPRYYNMMLDAWETKYHNNRSEGIRLLDSLCQQNLHLVVPFAGGKVKSSPSQSDLLSQDALETSAEPAAGEEYATDGTDAFNEQEAADTDATFSEAKKPKPSSRTGIGRKRCCDRRTMRSVVRGMQTTSSTSMGEQTSDAMVDTEDTEDEVELEEAPVTDSCFKLLAEMQQQQGGSLKTFPESKVQYPSSCKLETSMMSESSGKNIMSPPKHIHSIKMNISS